MTKEQQQALEEFVKYVATDYYETGTGKTRLQRDDYQRRAKDLWEWICLEVTDGSS